MRWRDGVPATPVRALLVHPRDGDLVIGTHGRGVLILDDIRPLRELAADPSIRQESVHVFTPPPTFQANIAERIGYRSTGHAMFHGENRPFGALISAWVGEEAESSKATVEILDDAGTVFWSVEETVSSGLNRFTWDLRKAPPSGDEGFFGPGGTPILPGHYRVRMVLEGEPSETLLEVLADPRIEIPATRRLAKIEALETAGAWISLSGEARNRLQEAIQSVSDVLGSFEAGGEGEELREAGEALKATLEASMERLFTGPSCQGICGGDPVASPIRQPMGMLSSSLDEPSPNDRAAMARALTSLRTVIDEVNALFQGPVADFRTSLQAGGFTPFPVREPLRVGRGG